MPVCRYFLRGNCVYGDRCRFEHSYPQESKVNTTSVFHRSSQENEQKARSGFRQQNYNEYDRFHFVRSNPQQSPLTRGNQDHSNSSQQYYSGGGQRQPWASYDEVLATIIFEVNSIENCNVWKLSCLAPVRTYGSLPGWYDYSPEEVRWAAYLAKEHNSYEQFKSWLDKLLMQVKLLRDSVKSCSPHSSALLDVYMNQKPDTIHCLEHLPPYFAIAPVETTAESNSEPVIESEMEETANAPPSAPTQNLFGSVPSIPQNNIFGSVAPPPQTNIFGSVSQVSSGNIFGSVPKVSSTNIFGSVPQRPTSDNIFGSVPASQSSGNIFGGGYASAESEIQETGAPMDLKTKFNFKDNDLDYNVLSFVWKGDSYTPIIDLSEEEIRQFKAPKFSHGKVPLVPPPKEFC